MDAKICFPLNTVAKAVQHLSSCVLTQNCLETGCFITLHTPNRCVFMWQVLLSLGPGVHATEAARQLVKELPLKVWRTSTDTTAESRRQRGSPFHQTWRNAYLTRCCHTQTGSSILRVDVHGDVEVLV